MTKISLIAAIDENRGLGKENQLLCHLPADLKHFKSLTMGKPILMGRKTYESIGKPLPHRLNIVLTQQAKDMPGVIIANSIDEGIKAAKDAEEVMIIGGEGIFRQALPLATRIYLTVIHHTFDADVFFPTFDESKWNCNKAEFRAHDDKNPFDMTFCRYEKINR